MRRLTRQCSREALVYVLSLPVFHETNADKPHVSAKNKARDSAVLRDKRKLERLAAAGDAALAAPGALAAAIARGRAAVYAK
jgi:hypothetical protein